MLRPPKTRFSVPPDCSDNAVTSDAFKRALSDNRDIVFNELSINGDKNEKITVCFIDGMVNLKMIDDFVLKPLILGNLPDQASGEQDIVDFIMLGAVYHCQRKLRCDFSECMTDLLGGSVILIFDKIQTAVTFEVKGFEKRGISESSSESVLKGSKETFIEVLRINTALVRRRIQSGNLKIHQLSMGDTTKTAVSVVYLSGVANAHIVEQIKGRLCSVNIDGIVSAGQIEMLLTENKKSVFPQILYTERTDKFCACILEGRIGVIIDGMPVAFITPVDVNSFLQAPEDYSYNFVIGSAIRAMRYLCAFAAFILPAFYVSVTSFHQEMIPTTLAVSIISSKQGVPFPTYMEVFLMLIAFEVLLEAGLRLPHTIGPAVSIVGALVVGQAAIAASLVSPGVVIIIAASGITGFVMPSQDISNTIRLLRVVLVLFSIIGGLFTVTICLILVVYHMCTLEIFGVPYFSPLTSNEGKSMFTDSVIVKPRLNVSDHSDNINSATNKRQDS